MTTRLNVMPFGTQVLFRCPRNPERECAADLRGMTGSGQTWENIGTDEKPTLMPSYNCTNGCGWHGYIVDGECVDAPPGISSIVACSSCRSPHLVRVALSHDVHGGLQVGLGFDRLSASAPSPEDKGSDND